MKIVIVNEHSEGYGVSVEPTGDFRLIGMGKGCTVEVRGGGDSAELYVYVSNKRICVTNENNIYMTVDITTTNNDLN